MPRRAGEAPSRAGELPIPAGDAVREFANKSAASAASPDYVKFQAVIKSAASAASLREKIIEQILKNEDKLLF